MKTQKREYPKHLSDIRVFLPFFQIKTVVTRPLTPFSRQKPGSYVTFHTNAFLCDNITNGVEQMIHNVAAKIAKASCERAWIGEDDFEWCVYALEKRISILLYMTVVLLWIVVSGRLVDTLSFLLPFYLMRRRIGGCHVNSAGVCFTLSVLLVILASIFASKAAVYLPQNILIFADAAAFFTGLLVKPSYPPQAHFTQDERLANKCRKNILLCMILAAQCISLCIHDVRIFTCSFCGVSLAVVTAIIQTSKNKRSVGYEKV